MGVHIHIHQSTRDAWEESKHPRAPDGKFGSGGKSGGTMKINTSTPEGQRLASGLLRQAMQKPAPAAEKAKPKAAGKYLADMQAKMRSTWQAGEKETDPQRKAMWKKANEHYNTAMREARRASEGGEFDQGLFEEALERAQALEGRLARGSK